jgi:4-hydroxybenzoate polyprenyltransferase
LFIFDTILIAAGGYIINDIFDYKTDKVNKPEKTYISKDISLKNAILYYSLILSLGFVISIYIAIVTDNLPLLFLYPLACGLLYVYSKKLKNTVLTGNIVVSAFVSFVPGVILIAERDMIFERSIPDFQNLVIQLFIFYLVFSFIVNLIREIIKDIEDENGDRINGYNTLPIKYGIQVAKMWCIFLSLVTIISLVVWMSLTNIVVDFRLKVYLMLMVAAPLVIIIQILTKTTQKRDFSKISTIIKWTMLAGLGALILITKTNI